MQKLRCARVLKLYNYFITVVQYCAFFVIVTCANFGWGELCVNLLWLKHLLKWLRLSQMIKYWYRFSYVDRAAARKAFGFIVFCVSCCGF